MRKFLNEKKSVIFKVLLLLLVLLGTSLLSLLLLTMFGIVSFEDGIVFNTALFVRFKNSWYGWFILILFETGITLLLCVIPGVSMALIMLTTHMFEYSWQAFVVSFITVMLSSTIMYLLGRYGGYKLCVKMLGKEDCDKSLELLRLKSTIYFPLMMMFPVFPDDALVMMAGTLKMKLKWFIPSIVLGRGIGILTIVFGLTIIPFNEFDSFYDWIVFFTVCLFWIIMIFKLAHKFNERLEEKSKSNNESIKNEINE